MRIAVIGATGRLGGAIARVAAERGHEVTSLGSAQVDGTDPGSIGRAVAGHGAVVASVKGPDRLVPRCARALVAAGVARLLFVGGAGSLRLPSGERYVDAADFPPHLRQASLDQVEALEILRGAPAGVEWTYLSPPPVPLVDGGPTGRYSAEARDCPIPGTTGSGQFRVGDLAAAAVDALEQRAFVRQRFTVGYRGGE